ncbi:MULTISPECIES: hypothetical protein [unclassified Clostridium]|uniref:hypothetical protein n=1 Tax=unclassified Clostridium TaxID=2614128 RepID=UPI0025C6D12E|nr:MULTISPECIES: hypothetical protein [unclassified Clostridium]
MSKYLYVKGEDFSAMTFEENFNPQKVYEEMIEKGIDSDSFEFDGTWIEVKIKTFNEVNPEFEYFVKSELCDYDMLKDVNLFRVDEEE